MTPRARMNVVIPGRWWSRRADMRTVDLATRWPLYVVSASEPLVMLQMVVGQPELPAWAAPVLLLLALSHTVACVALLHAGIAHFLGGPRPSARLVGVAVALTAAGVAASVAAFAPIGGAEFGSSGAWAALLFCAGFMGGVTPLLPVVRLLALAGLTAAVAGVLLIAVGLPGRLWTINFLVVLGTVPLVYRPTVWILGALWEMDRARHVQARLGVAEERLRFARDLHDVLGRNLALIAVNSELAAQLLRRGKDGAVERMLEVHQIAQDSMREVREVVAGCRTADLDSELAGARSVLRSAGIGTRVIGAGADLPAAAQAALGWVVREATTNIIRHSEATTVTIDLCVVHDAGTGSAALLRIENDGAHPPGVGGGTGGGSGLAGLRERLAALGGDLCANAPSGGRFLVLARLPLTRQTCAAAKAAEPVP